MFLLSKALKYIEATEPHVLAVHRSSASVSLVPEGHKTPQMCEAYLCVVRDNGVHERVYAALHLARDNASLVYTPDPSLLAQTTSDIVRHALSFLEKMGFQMESCNLGGNPALREVVIRGMKVLRSPGPASPKPPPQPSAGESESPAPVAGGVEALHGSVDPVALTAPAAGGGQGRPGELSAGTDADELETLRAELERVREENCALAATSSTRISELERDLVMVQAELALADATKNALALLQEDYEALRAEYAMINEELTARQIDMQRVCSETEAALEAAAQEIAALKSTIVQLTDAKMKPEKDVAERPASQGSAATTLSTDSEGTRREERAEPAGDDPVSFQLDPSFTAVPCRSLDEVIELRVSFNNIRMICGTAHAQNCAAYICGVKRDGTREIYLALYQTEDKKSVVYVPGRQPADAAEYEQVMESAISFAEVSGFTMHQESLGGGAAARAKILEKVPVLGRF